MPLTHRPRDRSTAGHITAGSLTVGQLARRTGLSVRTLHHYDEIGLLRPTRRSEAGYRLYTAADVARLQQIKSLRQLGFGLEEIATLLDRPDLPPRRVIALHLARLEEQQSLLHRLIERLRVLDTRLASTEEVSAEEFIATIKEMTIMENVEKYYTPEQLEELARRRKHLGEAHIQEVEVEWPQLIAAMRAAMERGDDPAGPEVQALARRWRELIAEFTGGNPTIERSLGEMYRNEPDMRARNRLDEELFAYVNRAMSAS